MHQVNLVDRIRISRFRRLYEINLEMRPLMVLIGANGVGKTSLLEALTVLSASAAGTLNRKLNALGGVADIITRDGSSDISFEADMNVPGDPPLTYELQLTPSRHTYAISREILSQLRKEGSDQPFKHIDSRPDHIRYFDPKNGLIPPNWEHNPLETLLSEIPKMFREPEELRRILSATAHYHALDVNQRAPVKLPQQMKPADTPGENGEDLIPFLYYLREAEPDCYEIIEDTLKVAFPRFESLNFPPVASGMLAMTWKEQGFRKPFYWYELSEGTLRFLWLASLLQSTNPATITLIDEPEVSLHPELLSLMVHLLREASLRKQLRTQIIVATHSDRLIRFLRPEEVVVMDINEEGYATACWADSLDLEEWLREYTFDEVWRMGRMGGRA
jgi:predicted ATPase